MACLVFTQFDGLSSLCDLREVCYKSLVDVGEGEITVVVHVDVHYTLGIYNVTNTTALSVPGRQQLEECDHILVHTHYIL